MRCWQTKEAPVKLSCKQLCKLALQADTATAAHATDAPGMHIHTFRFSPIFVSRRYALNTLMNIFHTSRLPTGLKQDTLARMVRTLLLRLVDDNLGKQPEGEALLKVRVC